MPRVPRKPNQELRDYPIYTVAEAATYLAMPKRTLYHWVSDDPLWARTSGTDDLLLSFQDLAQTFFVEFVRRHAHISVEKARGILLRAKEVTGSPYPLLDKNIKLLFRHIVHDRPARGRRKRQIVDLSQYPQYVIPDVVDLFAQRISRDRKGQLRAIFPWRHYAPGKNEDRPVSVNPEVLSGRLVVTGTRIPAQTIWERTRTGESVSTVADDYGISEKLVNDALRHLVLRKEAA